MASIRTAAQRAKTMITRPETYNEAKAEARAQEGSSVTRDLRVDGQRLWQSLMDLARIGATEKGGVRRLALTDLDRQGRDLVCGWLREAGCAITVDHIGNIFARRSGTDDSLPPVVFGSHIDTQPSGGKFDGNYGVLAALEVVRTLEDRDLDQRGRHAFHAGDDGFGRVRRRIRIGSCTRAERPRWQARRR
jgi:hypothetical protein